MPLSDVSQMETRCAKVVSREPAPRGAKEGTRTHRARYAAVPSRKAAVSFVFLL